MMEFVRDDPIIKEHYFAVSKGTLLLADDSITIQKVVNLTFADEGIDVIAVGDGDTAAARLAEIKPDIVLADVNMPGMTGYQICEMIRGNESTKDLPVVLLVGSFEPFDEAEAHRVGANSYMTKPFQSIRQLVSQVTDLMENRGSVPEAAVSQVSEPPAEAVSEEATAGGAGDIESLYQSSFAAESDTFQDSYAEAEPVKEHIDAGMDDEMILTTYANGEPAEAGWAFQSETDSPVLETVDTPSAIVEDETPVSGDTQMEELALDPFADTVPLETSEPRSEHGWNEEPNAESENVVEFPVAVEGERRATFDLIPPAPAKTREDEFDEVDLLEIPGVESGKLVEFDTAETASSTENPTQVVSLSPELMEILVQKVVEKLSEKY